SGPVAPSGRTSRSAGWISSHVGTNNTRAPRNTHRQPANSVTRPVTSGPSTDGRTQAAANNENIRGRNTSGNVRAISTISPTSTSPSARPLSSRPATIMGMPVAVPTSSWPSPNPTTPARSGGPGPARSAHSPVIANDTTNAAMGAAFAPPNAPTASNSCTRVGSAVPTARFSKAVNVTSATAPKASGRLARLNNFGDGAATLVVMGQMVHHQPHSRSTRLRENAWLYTARNGYTRHR